MVANTINDNNVQAYTARQAATVAIREAKRALAKAHERERNELARELAAMQSEMEQHRVEISEEMQQAITAAIRKANSRDDLLVLYRADIERLIGSSTLAKLRQESAPGSMPMMVLATAPVNGEKAPRGPVLAVVDLTKALGWQE